MVDEGLTTDSAETTGRPVRPSTMKERWDGGYIRRDKDGRPTYVIQRMVAGRAYHISTRTHGIRAALEHLKRFEEDPSSYSPQGTEPEKRLELTEALVEEYRAHCEGKGNSAIWLAQKMTYVTWWKDELRGLDLKRLSLPTHIIPALDRAKGARAHRIAVLKHFYAWLRTEKHAIAPTEDPTYGVLRVPQSNPGTRRVKDKAIPRNHVALAREHLVGHWRDALDVLAATGAHTRALVRFAQSGMIEPYRGPEPDAKWVLTFPLEKDGDMHRAAVREDVGAPARRLLERGTLDEKKLVAALAQACKAAKIPVFTPARLRHSVATWAIEAGASPEQVAAFLGHRSPATTRRFYATFAVPPPPATLTRGR